MFSQRAAQDGDLGLAGVECPGQHPTALRLPR